jgi:hypothetical protein
MYASVFARASRDVRLKMRFYQVLPFRWCAVATHVSHKTVSSVSWRLSIGSKLGKGEYSYFNRIK